VQTENLKRTMKESRIAEWGKSARGAGNSAHAPGAETRRGQAGKGLGQLLT